MKQKKFVEVLMSEFPDCNMRCANSVKNASLFTQSAPVGVEIPKIAKIVALLKFFPAWKGRNAG